VAAFELAIAAIRTAVESVPSLFLPQAHFSPLWPYLLVEGGCWLLVAGCWLLVAGCWLLVGWYMLLANRILLTA
jgi:hypothetical protein